MKRWKLNVVVMAALISLNAQAWAQNAPAAPAAPAKEVADPKVTLREPGAESRKPLRYAFVKDSKHTLTMTMQMGLTQSLGAMQMPETKIPAMDMVMDVHITDVQANGDANYEFVLSSTNVRDEPGANPMMVNMVKKSLTTMVGMKGSATVSSRGFTRDVKVEVPPNADAMVKEQVESMRQSMNQFAAPLPEEPVGKGAKWDIDAEVSAGGIQAHQRTTMTLENIEGDALDLSIAITQTAEEQDVKNPNIPPTAKVRLTSFNSKGSGKTKLRLSQSVPVHAEVTNESDQTMKLSGPNMEQELSQHLRMTMTMKEGAPEAKPETETAPPAKPEKEAAPTRP